MTRKQLERLGAALHDARIKALIVAGITDDNTGSSNFDTCTITLPRVPVAKVLKQGELSNMRMSRSHTGEYFISAPVNAQGAVNTKQAETIRDVLKAHGFETASVHYAMD